jgi:hypothetical protein
MSHRRTRGEPPTYVVVKSQDQRGGEPTLETGRNHAGVVAPFPGRTRGSTNYIPPNVSLAGPRRAGGEPTWDMAACCAPSARRHWRSKASSTQRSDRRILQTGYEAHKILAAHAKYFFFSKTLVSVCLSVVAEASPHVGSQTDLSCGEKSNQPPSGSHMSAQSWGTFERNWMTKRKSIQSKRRSENHCLEGRRPGLRRGT